MRARVLVGEISCRSTGATRSGLIGEIQPGIFIRRAIGLARLQILQPVGVDGDGVGFDGRGSRDRAGDDLGLHQQALRPRVDQAGAELREIENARHQRDQAGKVQRNDAAGQAGEAECEKKLTGPAQPVERPLPALAARLLGGSAVRNEGRRERPRRSGSNQAAFDQAMAKTAGCFDTRIRVSPLHLTPVGRRRQSTMRASKRPQVRFP